MLWHVKYCGLDGRKCVISYRKVDESRCNHFYISVCIAVFFSYVMKSFAVLTKIGIIFRVLVMDHNT